MPTVRRARDHVVLYDLRAHLVADVPPNDFPCAVSILAASRIVSPSAPSACACRKLDPHILVMQSAQDGAAEYATNGRDSAWDRGILVQG